MKKRISITIDEETFISLDKRARRYGFGTAGCFLRSICDYMANARQHRRETAVPAEGDTMGIISMFGDLADWETIPSNIYPPDMRKRK